MPFKPFLKISSPEYIRPQRPAEREEELLERISKSREALAQHALDTGFVLPSHPDENKHQIINLDSVSTAESYFFYQAKSIFPKTYTISHTVENRIKNVDFAMSASIHIAQEQALVAKNPELIPASMDKATLKQFWKEREKLLKEFYDAAHQFHAMYTQIPETRFCGDYGLESVETGARGR